ncbi:uncharacterized protein LOC144642621 isoform X2 [Oculina patagonica]
MSYVPNHSYIGQYYFNPQWVQVAGENSPSSLVYGNVVNYSVGPDGTHYFYQTYSGQFVAPTTQTVQSVTKTYAPPSYDEAVKPQTEKASGSNHKETESNTEKEHCNNDKIPPEDGAEDNYSSDDDVWATEDEDYGDYIDNDSDSSQEEYNDSCLRDYPRDRRRPLRHRRENSPRSPRREVDARSTIVSLVPKDFQGF